MSMYKRYETSKKLSTQGAEMTFPANEDGSVPTLIIARAHSANQLHAKAVATHYTPEVMEALENMSEDDALALSIEVFLDGCLIGWKNITDRDDQPLEFTRENARQFFTDLPDVFTTAVGYSKNMGNYLRANEEKAIKN